MINDCCVNIRVTRERHQKVAFKREESDVFLATDEILKDVSYISIYIQSIIIRIYPKMSCCELLTMFNKLLSLYDRFILWVDCPKFKNFPMRGKG